MAGSEEMRATVAPMSVAEKIRRDAEAGQLQKEIDARWFAEAMGPAIERTLRIMAERGLVL